MNFKKFHSSLCVINKFLGILCAVMFIMAACRVTNAYIEHAESIIKIENNEVKN